MMLQTKLHQATYQKHRLSNDPMQVIQHTLPNGLNLFLSVNKMEPRVFTNIVVRAGSKQDPSHTTGLAHYMEHMLFKGTSKIGTLNWEEEKKLLEEISELFEQHRATNDPDRKKAIYQQIDQLSQEAAKWVVPNEYDNLASAIGADGTNAYTWVDQTVFVNDIPSNEIERWMELESERFRMMALRLFHTELETVYEEFNISQDRDIRKANNALRLALFPQHPYGTQTTLGSADSLKNPSQVQIQQYFNTYYVPNNMAIVMAGDFDPDVIIDLAERYFGHFETKDLPVFNFQEQPPIETPIKRKVWGNEAGFVLLGWRFGNSQSEEPLMLALISNLLYNGVCGSLDVHLNQKQKVLASESWAWNYQDYSLLGLYAKPKENQTLEEAEQLLLGQLEMIKEGQFDESLIEATINNEKVQESKALERNRNRVHLMTEAFVLGIDWKRIVDRFDWFNQQNKDSVIAFARKNFSDNYVVVYKEQGPDPNIIKVEKPPITSIQLNRGGISDFAKQFLQKQPTNLTPDFVNFHESVQRRKLTNGVILNYVSNPINDLFRLDFIFEVGTLGMKKLALVEQYSELMGTVDKSVSELASAFFKMGVKFDFHTYQHRTYLTLQGLSQSFKKSLQLLQHVISKARAKQEVLDQLTDDILTKRINAKQNKRIILKRAMQNYGRYGEQSPYKHRLSEEELRNTSATELEEIIRNLFSFEHSVYYYGNQSVDSISQIIEQNHKPKLPLVSPPKSVSFSPLTNEKNQVFFVDFPMVQTELLLVSNGTPYFNYPEYLFQSWYNDYFGSGLSSIVFQEIRESKGFAYSCYAHAYRPSRSKESHYLNAYLGTQPDKVQDALPTILDLIHQMPLIPKQLENARLSQLKQIASERMKPYNLFWEARTVKDLGFHHDLRSDIYKRLLHSNQSDLIQYHQKFIQDRFFNIMVLGDKSNIDLSYFERFGPLRELSMENIFGF